jgi:hypothetical protein
MLHRGVTHRSTSCCVLLDHHSYSESNFDPDQAKAQHLKSATVRKEVVDRVFAPMAGDRPQNRSHKFFNKLFGGEIFNMINSSIRFD